MRIPRVGDDRCPVSAFGGHLVDTGDQTLKSPLLALGNLGRRCIYRCFIIVEAFEERVGRTADRLAPYDKFGLGRDIIPKRDPDKSSSTTYSIQCPRHEREWISSPFAFKRRERMGAACVLKRVSARTRVSVSEMAKVRSI